MQERQIKTSDNKQQDQFQEEDCYKYYEQMMIMQMQQMIQLNQEHMSDPVNLVPVYPNNNYNYHFKTDFLRAMNYDNPQEIIKVMPHLSDINRQNIDSLIKNNNNVYQIMRSTNDDDIHKAIKYQVWCSSVKNNQLLSQTYQQAQINKQQVYLIFSVVKSYQFCGIARLESDLETDKSYQHWWEDNKYFGSFKIKWIFIKDVNDKLFKDIKQQDNIPIARLRDSTKIDVAIGNKIMQIFASQPNNQSIFNNFAFMDKREDIKAFQKQMDALSTAYFNQLASQYHQDPIMFQKNKKKIHNTNSNGLYNNPYYIQQKNKNNNNTTNTLNLEDKFNVKKNQTRTNNNYDSKKKQLSKNKNNYKQTNTYKYEPDKNANILINESEDEINQQDQQIQRNDNLNRPLE